MKKKLLSIFSLLLLLGSCSAPAPEKLSEEEFQNPSIEYRPRTWYHVNSGNMSKEGFTKDLEAIERAGLGGVLVFNVSMGLPDGDVKYNSDEHRAILLHAAKECERLGLSFGVHNCDGWTSSGGPWVTPEHSMKIVVESETITDGGAVELQLPTPPTREDYYEDIAVVAYPTLDYQITDAAASATITTSEPKAKVETIQDGRIDTHTQITASAKKTGWIQFDYGKPQTMRSISMFVANRLAHIELYASNNGVDFTHVCTPRDERIGKFENYFYGNIPETTARYFRIELPQSLTVIEASFSAGQRLHNMLGYTSYRRNQRALPKQEEGMTIDLDDVIILSDKMDSEGTLRATLPEGKWTVARYGYTTSGATNEPASDAGTGLEVDKMSRAALKLHYDEFVGELIKESRIDAPNAMQYAEVDSYEVGPQNWTDGLDKLFEERYGYDIKPFLPLFGGKIVASNEDIDNVFWDMQRLINDLMCTNYFDYFTELCNADGMLSYIEPYGFVGPFNSLDAGRKADIPMGEFWAGKVNQHKMAPVSSAHIYGKNVISAESFTSTEMNWGTYPAYLKMQGDFEWTNGINEYMFHRFAHQSNTHVKPGMTMYNVGSHIDRTQTWWDNAGAAWFKYLARGSYMLRQGRPVQDLLVFVGDRTPNHIKLPSNFKPKLPTMYKYDCVNADVIINRLTVKDGKLTLPDGVQYNALALPAADKITLETLRGINRLAQAGALIIGKLPARLGGYLQTDEMKAEFKSLTASIEASPRTYENYEWDEIFAANGIKGDLIVEGYPEFRFYHRQSDKEDIYFIYNPSQTEKGTFKCDFNVTGRVPEFWNAITGKVTRVPEYTTLDNRTQIEIELDGDESMFVVFRQAEDALPTVEYIVEEPVSTVAIDGEWNIQFRAEDFYDGSLKTDKLFDWKDSSNEDIKYYSGTAIYTTSFDIESDSALNYQLDLGEVYNSARVILNGVDLGVSWIAPFEVDITSALKSGHNDLRLEVTNRWTNRLIGDSRLPDQANYEVLGRVDGTMMPEWFRANKPMPEGPRKTWSSFTFAKPNDPLVPSGLVGEVKVVARKVVVK